MPSASKQAEPPTAHTHPLPPRPLALLTGHNGAASMGGARFPTTVRPRPRRASLPILPSPNREEPLPTESLALMVAATNRAMLRSITNNTTGNHKGQNNNHYNNGGGGGLERGVIGVLPPQAEAAAAAAASSGSRRHHRRPSLPSLPTSSSALSSLRVPVPESMSKTERLTHALQSFVRELRFLEIQHTILRQAKEMNDKQLKQKDEEIRVRDEKLVEMVEKVESLQAQLGTIVRNLVDTANAASDNDTRHDKHKNNNDNETLNEILTTAKKNAIEARNELFRMRHELARVNDDRARLARELEIVREECCDLHEARHTNEQFVRECLQSAYMGGLGMEVEIEGDGGGGGGGDDDVGDDFECQCGQSHHWPPMPPTMPGAGAGAGAGPTLAQGPTSRRDPSYGAAPLKPPASSKLEGGGGGHGKGKGTAAPPPPRPPTPIPRKTQGPVSTSSNGNGNNKPLQNAGGQHPQPPPPPPPPAGPPPPPHATDGPMNPSQAFAAMMEYLGSYSVPPVYSTAHHPSHPQFHPPPMPFPVFSRGLEGTTAFCGFHTAIRAAAYRSGPPPSEDPEPGIVTQDVLDQINWPVPLPGPGLALPASFSSLSSGPAGSSEGGRGENSDRDDLQQKKRTLSGNELKDFFLKRRIRASLLASGRNNNNGGRDKEEEGASDEVASYVSRVASHGGNSTHNNSIIGSSNDSSRRVSNVSNGNNNGGFQSPHDNGFGWEDNTHLRVPSFCSSSGATTTPLLTDHNNNAAGRPNVQNTAPASVKNMLEIVKAEEQIRAAMENIERISALIGRHEIWFTEFVERTRVWGEAEDP